MAALLLWRSSTSASAGPPYQSSSRADTPASATERKPRLGASEFRLGPIVSSRPASRRTAACSVSALARLSWAAGETRVAGVAGSPGEAGDTPGTRAEEKRAGSPQKSAPRPPRTWQAAGLARLQVIVREPPQRGLSRPRRAGRRPSKRHLGRVRGPRTSGGSRASGSHQGARSNPRSESVCRVAALPRA